MVLTIFFIKHTKKNAYFFIAKKNEKHMAPFCGYVVLDG